VKISLKINNICGIIIITIEHDQFERKKVRALTSTAHRSEDTGGKVTFNT